MGDPARNRDHDRPSACKAPAADSEPVEAKVAEPRKVVAGDPPNIEEQDPPLEATDSEDVDGDDADDDDDMDGTDEYSAASVTVRSSIWEHEFEGGRRVRTALLLFGAWKLERVADSSSFLLLVSPLSTRPVPFAKRRRGARTRVYEACATPGADWRQAI